MLALLTMLSISKTTSSKAVPKKWLRFAWFQPRLNRTGGAADVELCLPLVAEFAHYSESLVAGRGAEVSFLNTTTDNNLIITVIIIITDCCLSEWEVPWLKSSLQQESFEAKIHILFDVPWRPCYWLSMNLQGLSCRGQCVSVATAIHSQNPPGIHSSVCVCASAHFKP